MDGHVCVLGSFNVDIVANVPRFPRGGETLIGTSCAIGPGGKGANQALAAARAGASAHFIGKIGNDTFAGFARGHLDSCGIASCSLYESPTEPTGRAVIYVSRHDAENMIAIYPGANLTLTTAEIQQAAPHITAADVLLVQMETNFDAVSEAMRLARAAGGRVICNPAPYVEDLDGNLAEIDVITPNATEASRLSGIDVHDLDGAKAAARVISAQGPSVVIVTLGAAGVLLFKDGAFTHVPAFAVVPVDSTGAGDAFNGAFAAALSRGESDVAAVEFACAFASLAVELPGAANLPDAAAALTRLRARRVAP